jgi:hypoxanthine-DNA glycosylase
MLHHPFEPIWNQHSNILILGSFPSVKSREEAFYYAHPQNRFWQVIAALFDAPVPSTIEAKKALLLHNNVAVWDVIQSCEIIGSSDGSIKNATGNDIRGLIRQSTITRIFANGAKACDLYRKHCEQNSRLPIVQLPSTSPANAAWRLDRLIETWRIIL